MITTVYGWTTEQWAYAKQRHKLHGGGDLPADSQAMLALREWWDSHDWPEPMSVRIEGVTLESDQTWAAKAMAAALVEFLPRTSACSL